MKSRVPKVMHPIAGLPMIAHVIRNLMQADLTKLVGVIGAGMENVRSAFGSHPCVIQSPPLGTGHAVQIAARYLLDQQISADLILIAFGDTPLVRAETYRRACELLEKESALSILVVAFEPDNPEAYGRVITDNDGTVTKIVEQLEATPSEKAVSLCNSGMMVFRAKVLFDLLPELTNTNSKHEYYLTDTIHLAHKKGLKVGLIVIPPDEVLGINSPHELAAAEAIFQSRLRTQALDQGVRMQAPETVFLSADTIFGTDVWIEPYVTLGPGVTVGSGTVIHSFSWIEGTHIGDNAQIGPFARLRSGTILSENTRIGNFVEVKKTTIGKGSKVNHLSYIGDAVLGSQVNVGAGTITCNFDGFGKGLTEIGDHSFIGSNSALVAPVKIGADVVIGAGSVITKNVEDQALAIARTRQEVKPDWTLRYRKLKEKKT